MVNLRFNYPSISREGEIFKNFMAAHADMDPVLKLSSPIVSENGVATLAPVLGLNSHILKKQCSVISCSSGSQAIFSLLFALRKQQPLIGVEDFTYSGFKGTAEELGYTLWPIECDEEGLLPAALEAAIATGVKIIYVQPTIQNPTCRVMSERRRSDIVRIIHNSDLYIIEDDAYRFLHPAPPSTFLQLLPSRTIHIFSLSKPFNTFIKSCFIVLPQTFLPHLPDVFRVTGGGTSSLSVAFALHLLQQQDWRAIIKEKQQEAIHLQAGAKNWLEGLTYHTLPTSYHLWIQLPPPHDSKTVAAQLAEKEIIVSGGHEFSVHGNTGFIRIALSAEKNYTVLERAVRQIQQLLVG